MGDLIVMTRARPVPRRDGLKTDGADILFFTGVRYASMPDVDPALASVVPVRRATKPRRGPRKAGDKKRA